MLSFHLNMSKCLHLYHYLNPICYQFSPTKVQQAGKTETTWGLSYVVYSNLWNGILEKPNERQWGNPKIR